ncbi:hypothetical protein ASF05_00590 [Aeromicrobium sp. Leaf245]|nr:hypothetical protein ASF05_00590 [Aeromicrobium sp. Leaf245]
MVRGSHQMSWSVGTPSYGRSWLAVARRVKPSSVSIRPGAGLVTATGATTPWMVAGSPTTWVRAVRHAHARAGADVFADNQIDSSATPVRGSMAKEISPRTSPPPLTRTRGTSRPARAAAR